jgi:hypothetical protein
MEIARLVDKQKVLSTEEKIALQNEGQDVNLSETSQTCPNCGAVLEGRKCKLLCTLPGCGYMVTCSEW